MKTAEEILSLVIDKDNFPEAERVAFVHRYSVCESELLSKIAELQAAYEGVLHDATAISKELEDVENRLNNLETLEREGKYYVSKESVDKILLEGINK